VSHRLRRRQIVGGDLSTVFGFFKNPFNLEALTPPWLGFAVLHASDAEVRVGARIGYRLHLHGLPLRWESRIAEYVEGQLFADEMLRGPYRRWYHRHLFRTVPGGVEIADIVDYRLPLGVLGRLAHVVAVRRQLSAIFGYRERRIAQLFSYRPAGSARQGVHP
jgi:ligand-binding SRPBCC domain-containing protein